MKITTAPTIFDVYLMKDFNRCMRNNQLINLFSIAEIAIKNSQRIVTHNS